MVKEENKEENILEKIKREITNFKNKKKALINELRIEFPKLLIPFFEQSDVMEEISWTQYTPYFMDGDECIFDVNLDYLLINGESESESKMFKELLSVKIKSEDDIERDKIISEEKGYKYRPKKIGDYGYKKNINYSKNESSIVKNIKSVLKEIPDDFYKDMFGDHVMVTVYKSGKIKVIDYDHE